MIWATRGKTWGNVFLRDGGLADPLPTYDRVIAELGENHSGWCRVGDLVGVRFEDPLGRADRVGRAIVHEFVIDGPLAEQINSTGDAIELIWPTVADEYDEFWDAPHPPVGTQE